MCPLFSPPLFMQRYQFVVDFVQAHGSKKVLDLGCAECSLLKQLQYHGKGVELLVGVDKDSSSMKTRMHSFAPLSSDYLQPREGPLEIELYQGNVTQPDPITRGFDLITCIELIEHMQLEDVERFSEVLFGFMAPSAVIVSTPNADYNPLLPGLVGFRHPDHKFEWSRQEFQLWAVRLSELFGYSVSITGVGALDDAHTDVGFCSQIAVFNRKPSQNDPTNQHRSRGEPTVYRLLYSVAYPSLSDNNVLQRMLVNEVLSQAEQVKAAWLSGEWAAKMAGAREPYRQGGDICVSLLDVWACPQVKHLCGTLRRFTEALVGERRVPLTPDRQAVIVPTEEEDEEELDEEEEDEEEMAAVEARCTTTTTSVATEDWEEEITHSAVGELTACHVLAHD
ncbi:small RNA 2'-O-methyltransferase [Engraulis encrasicolus]|uniref:small RNA 2'-O-methyltransferase n=1 Tax=Engraulis encrasicolus TaxID=184585 RepID=UPI002FD09F39